MRRVRLIAAILARRPHRRQVQRRQGVALPGHDDLLISAALCACLDRLPWRAEFEGEAIPPGEGGPEERF